MGETNNEEALKKLNEEFNKQLIELQETMSTLNTDHKRTVHDCYSEYFDHKVWEFQHIEKQIELLMQSFRTKGSKENDLPQIEKVKCVTEQRNELLPNIHKSFDCIKSEGFGVTKNYNFNNQAIDPVRTHLKSGDNFCEFILKEFDNCDNEIPMIGYGMQASGLSQINNIDSPQNSTLEVNLYPAVNVYPSATDTVNSNPTFDHQYYLKKIPPRLRYKRHFPLMVEPTDNNYSSDMEIKRKREIATPND